MESENKSGFCRNFKEYHVLTSSLIFISLLIILFSNDNPSVLASIYIFILSIIISCSAKEKFKTGFIYFIPAAILIIAINMFFVGTGNTVLFYFLGSRVTLESIIYGIIMAFKLLGTIYLFMILEIMIDSDRAVSYFSSIMPKSTLMLMVSFKLIPGMKKRFDSLKEIYEIRGVVFDKKKSKEKVASFVPVLSILLEDSMEESFTIGETAYVRGFLSGKRSVYERQKFHEKDIEAAAMSILLMIFYCIAQFKGWIEFNIYDGVSFVNFINTGTIGIGILISVMTLIVILNSKEKEYGIHRD